MDELWIVIHQEGKIRQIEKVPVRHGKRAEKAAMGDWEKTGNIVIGIVNTSPIQKFFLPGVELAVVGQDGILVLEKEFPARETFFKFTCAASIGSNGGTAWLAWPSM